MARTLKELAKEVLAVQDACNLSGVALSFGRAMVDLGEHTNGTDERNKHPISVLWADKIAHLTGTQEIGNSVAMAAYPVVQKLAEPYEEPKVAPAGNVRDLLASCCPGHEDDE